MILTTEDIGKVFRLKPNKFHWCIPIQENIMFSDTNPKYVIFEQMAAFAPLYFGHIVESNMFGPITKPCEIEFAPNDIDEKEIYKDIDEFNKAKNIPYNEWLWGTMNLK